MANCVWKLQNPCLLPGCSTFFNGQKRLFFSVPAPLCASAGGHTLVDLWEEELHLSFWLEFGWVEGAELHNGAKVFFKAYYFENICWQNCGNWHVIYDVVTWKRYDFAKKCQMLLMILEICQNSNVTTLSKNFFKMHIFYNFFLKPATCWLRLHKLLGLSYDFWSALSFEQQTDG